MSFYNMLFGQNPQSDLLLAVIGFRKNDVERFRDVFVSEDGSEIHVYTRTGGGNRSDYPQLALYRSPLFVGTEDDDFDCTYATFRFKVPEEFTSDVENLSDIFEHGIRKEFAHHLAKTLKREPTEGDKEAAAYAKESAELSRTQHVKANGHTFVPYNDHAMKTALRLAEANGGELRSAWGILPLRLVVKTDDVRFPNAKPGYRDMDRVRIDYEWEIDEAYWQRCEERFASEYPLAMAKIRESVQTRIDKQGASTFVA